MNESVTFDIRIKDLGSSALAKFAANANKHVKRIQKLTGGLDKGLVGTTKKVDSLTRSFNKINSSSSGIKDLNKGLKTASGHMDRILNKANKLRLSGGRKSAHPIRGAGGGILGGLIPGNLATLGGGLLTGFGIKNLISSGAELEQTRVAFSTLLGSAEQGNKMIDMINNMANRTPFMNKQLFDAGKLLLNFGITQDRVLPTLRMLGDVSGGNADRFNSLSLAFGQMMSAGRLMGQYLLQFINAGFNPLQELSKMTGKSMAELKEDMAAGAITSEMVVSAFQNATSEGGKFFKMMEKQSQTLGGKWSTFVGKLQLKFAQFSEGTLKGSLTKVVDWGIGLVDRLDPFLNLLSRGFARAIGWISGFISFIRNNWDWLSVLTVGILGIVTAIKAWSIAQAALNLVMSINPVGLIIGAVLGLAAAFVYVYNRSERFRMVLGGLWGALKWISEGIGRVFTDPIGAIKSAWEGIKNFMIDQIKPLLEMVDLIKKGEYLTAAKKLGQVAFNFSPAGMIFNASKKIFETQTVKKGTQETKDTKIGLPSFLTDKMKVPGTSPAFAGFQGIPGTQNKLGSVKHPETQSASIQPIAGNQIGGKSIVVAIDALMKDTQITVNDGSDIKDFKSRLSDALLEVVKDVEISFSS